MTMPIIGAHNGVPPYAYPSRRPTANSARLPTVNSAVCRCGAVYDNGNILVPAEFVGLCGRCAFERGRRLDDYARRG
jgi:hypothetical protein